MNVLASSHRSPRTMTAKATAVVEVPLMMGISLTGFGCSMIICNVLAYIPHRAADPDQQSTDEQARSYEVPSAS